MRCGRFVQDQETFRDQYGRFLLDDWWYMQLQNVTLSLPQVICPPSSETLFKKLCMSTNTISHSIYMLYGMLQCLEPKGKSVYREWKRDMQHVFTETQLDHLYRFTHSSSVDTKMQENGFKILVGIGFHVNLLEFNLPFQMITGGSVDIGVHSYTFGEMPQTATLLARYLN